MEGNSGTSRKDGAPGPQAKYQEASADFSRAEMEIVELLSRH